jgi:hypothetical protein
MEIIVESSTGVLQARFAPHRVDREEQVVITNRGLRHPPVPVGAVLKQGGEVLGEVLAVVPTHFNRWEIRYAPPEAEEATEAAAEAEEVIQEEAEVSPAHPAMEAEVESGTPLETLDLGARISGALEEAGLESVEALQAFVAEQGEDALVDLDGIGVKSAGAILNALED